MTQNEAKKTAQSLGMTIKKTDAGDYRVNFKNGSEATAYYTDDLQDAVDTAKHMSARSTN